MSFRIASRGTVSQSGRRQDCHPPRRRGRVPLLGAALLVLAGAIAALFASPFPGSDAGPAGAEHSDSALGMAAGARFPQALPSCDYSSYEVRTLREHASGASWLPDGRILYSEQFEGEKQIHVINPDGTGRTCLTCGSPGGNDGPASSPDGSLIVFVSNRDHPYAIGGAGGGMGQELYVMRTDGSDQTRLTFSADYATNFYNRFSRDGTKILWTTTRDYTWDVVMADLVEDIYGFRLENTTTLTRDTSWNESHEFTLDDREVLYSSTRDGLMNSDIYVMDLATRAVTRVTDHPGWDEHAHLSPDGQKMVWISSRFQPTALEELTELPPVFDFFFIQQLFFAEFINQPLGFMTELYLMNADGSEIQRLTFDEKVAAGPEWSPDGTMIAFTSTEPGFLDHTLKLLAFDCVSP